MPYLIPLLVLAAVATFMLSTCTEDPTGPGRNIGVRVTPAVWYLAPGDRVTLEARVGRRQGDTGSEDVEWSSTDPGVAVVDAAGVVTALSEGSTRVVARTQGAADTADVVVVPPVLVGAGDIADCEENGDDATAALLDRIPGRVFTLGDNVYPEGRRSEYELCYGPTWGRHRDRTWPSAGNHEYLTPGAEPYYRYFGTRAGPAGKGYYSYDFAGWHVIVLNSEIGLEEGSPQFEWLLEDLAANPARCTLAYWHRPLFSSHREQSVPGLRAVWKALYEAGVEVVLNGHDHYYERFAPQAPDGTVDRERGIRQFIVGTGGKSRYPPQGKAPNSEVQQNDAPGVLKIELRPDGYTWGFVPVLGGTFHDEGSGVCH